MSWIAAGLVGCLVSGAVADEPGDGHRQAAERFLQAIEIEAVFDRVARQFADQLVRQRFELAPHEVAFREILREQLDYAVLKAPLSGYLVTVFTERELDEISAFYRTPAGKKAFQAWPGVTQSLVRIIALRLQETNAEWDARLRELVRRDAETP